MPPALATWICSLLLCVPQDPPSDPPTPASPPPKPAAGAPRIVWQRTLADALAAQQASGLPLLVVVNTDGETFNERFAGTVYHDPEFVELTSGYVCVVASPTRHTELDYDERGQRVECPRFGGCTCSEHIQIEPELYRRWFKEQRYAPRHVGVAPDGSVLFDRFLDASMATAIAAVKANRGTARAGTLEPTDDLAVLLARRDAVARQRLEQRYRTGDPAERRRLLTAAASAANQPIDLLRLALRGDDPSLLILATTALARTGSTDTQIDVEDALARIDDPQGRQSLVEHLAKLGKTVPSAARLAQHFAFDAKLPLAAPWGNAWSAPIADAADRDSVERLLDRCEATLRERADDGDARLQQAIGHLMLALLLIGERGPGVELWLADAQRSAERVRDGALLAEAAAVRAVAAWLAGDGTTAAASVVAALSTVRSDRRPDPWLAARFLETVIPLTAQIAYDRAKADPLANLRAQIERVAQAEARLDANGGAGEAAALAAIHLYEFAGLRRLARVRAEALLERFPYSAGGHERWRSRLLVDFGPERLRAEYARFLQKAADRPAAAWFAGYAELLVAETRVREQRTGPARAAYDAAIAHFTACAEGNPAYADNANHYAVLALAGRAVARMEADDGEGAVDDLLRAAALRPASLDDKDGLDRQPRGLALRVSRMLKQKGDKELAARLDPLLP